MEDSSQFELECQKWDNRELGASEEFVKVVDVGETEAISKILNLHARTMQINGTVDEKVDQLMSMFEKAEDRIFSEEQLDSLSEMCKIAKQEIREGKSMTPEEAIERLRENRKKVVDTK